jgi:predicted  nucleic acid-binding Zn ribbon protein
MQFRAVFRMGVGRNVHLFISGVSTKIPEKKCCREDVLKLSPRSVFSVNDAMSHTGQFVGRRIPLACSYWKCTCPDQARFLERHFNRTRKKAAVQYIRNSVFLNVLAREYFSGKS